ncbi:glycosyltransferase family 2 protein [Candidatus Woesearchaeota archaeon]|nr:glycosyltransferase family 2 protein [Nanoarchaeota archaeon]MCB9371128.1 glycosyltransferase family 2 protein [Candidatus Woesearchaeota archaeon]USN44156.1 MAG: glycosyltransferase family 2 protein [Candidatus Woesearchaeota archaeon]
MVKLVIQIPCYNEEKTLPSVLADLPKKIEGIKEIEVQIIDDGCTDKTVEVARKHGCHIVSYVGNKGLGVAFKTGMEEALHRGADILVNTDGDHQYPGKYIAELVQPILRGKADMVIGDRQTSKISHFSPIKKFFQWLGSSLTRFLSGTRVNDSVSGFRAYSKEAMLQLNVVSTFSYVLDTIVQAGKKGLKVTNITITTNKPTRSSRLFKNIFQHMKKSGSNLVRVFVMYEPFKFFAYVSGFFIVCGLIPLLRYLWFLFQGSGDGHIQSLLAGSVLLLSGVTLFGVGVLADLNAINRKLIEESLYMQKKGMYGGNEKLKGRKYER